MFVSYILLLLTVAMYGNCLKLDINPSGICKPQDLVHMSCSTDTADENKDVKVVKLYKIPLDSADTTRNKILIFAFATGAVKDFNIGEKMKNRSFLNSTNSSYLIQFNATHSDEGQYFCEGTGLMSTYGSQLKSLALIQDPSTPVISVVNVGSNINTLMVSDTIRVNCTAGVGKPQGMLKITGNDNKEIKGKELQWMEKAKDDSHGITVFKSIEFTKEIKEDDHGNVYTCSVVPNITVIGNISLSAKSQPLVVNYAVKHIKIEPFHDNFFHGDQILCSADGRPTPSIRWTQLSGASQLTFNGSYLVMSKNAKIGYYAFTCSAANNIRGINHEIQESIGFNLHNKTLPSTPSVGTKVKVWVQSHHKGISVALITVGALCGFILLAVICAYLYNTTNNSSTTYDRLNTDRAKLYGANNGEISSDEEESYQPLNKNSTEGHWLGTQV